MSQKIKLFDWWEWALFCSGICMCYLSNCAHHSKVNLQNVLASHLHSHVASFPGSHYIH